VKEANSKSKIMSDYELKYSKVIEFTGKKEDWAVWETKFLARARRRGFKDVLTGKTAIPPESESIDPDTEDGKTKEKAKEQNVLGYEDLMLSIKTDTDEGMITFQLIKNCVSDEYPDGNVMEAWKSLKNRFYSKTTTSKISLKREFQNMKMDKNENPETYVTKMEGLRIRMSYADIKISDEDFHLQIIGNLPKEYDIEVHEFETMMDDGNKSLDVEFIKKKLKTKYDKMNLNEEKEEEKEETNKSLITGRFKGRCFNCGKYGHKASDCRLKGNDRDTNDKRRKSFNGKCSYCGIYGHHVDNCWKKKNNTDKKGETTKANVALMTKPTQLESWDKLDDDVWIADSGATCHITKLSAGMYDVTELNESIEVADGNMIKVAKIGKLDVDIQQKNGKTVRATLQKVKFVPDSAFNLFDVMSTLNKGYKISNTGTDIILTKGSTTVTFDMKFRAKDGFLVGVRMQPVIQNTSAVAMPKGEVIM